jgi:hypothetical protein
MGSLGVCDFDVRDSSDETYGWRDLFSFVTTGEGGLSDVEKIAAASFNKLVQEPDDKLDLSIDSASAYPHMPIRIISQKGRELLKYASKTMIIVRINKDFVRLVVGRGSSHERIDAIRRPLNSLEPYELLWSLNDDE